jgi:hypothetical protein
LEIRVLGDRLLLVRIDENLIVGEAFQLVDLFGEVHVVLCDSVPSHASRRTAVRTIEEPPLEQTLDG